jgi:hypothetical protein
LSNKKSKNLSRKKTIKKIFFLPLALAISKKILYAYIMKINKSDLEWFNNPVIEFTNGGRTHCIGEVLEIHDDEHGVWVDVDVDRSMNIEIDVSRGVDLKDITEVIDPEEAVEKGLIDESVGLLC